MARRRNGRPTVDPSDAPICMTAASLPTEPPPATVRQVPRRMPGVSAAGTRRFLRMFPTTVSVARSTGNLSRRYRRMDAMPRTGSASRSHGKRPESLPAKSTARESTMEAPAPTAPTTAANATCRATWPKSKPCRAPAGVASSPTAFFPPASPRSSMPSSPPRRRFLVCTMVRTHRPRRVMRAWLLPPGSRTVPSGQRASVRRMIAHAAPAATAAARA